MDGLIWVLALITGAAIGIGCAFLLTALILNASNNKGDSRSKVEEFSSDIVFFSQQDSMRMNPQEFVNFTEWNAEALCKSQEYGTRLATSLPFASMAPVTRYIPGKEVQEPQYAVIDGASGGAAYGAINGVNAVSREPVIFTSDVMSAGAFRKAVIIEFGKEKMRTLKMIGEDGLYTNLALLLSDQCPSTIKVAVFQGADKALFRDRKEFNGSILKQLEEVYQFIDLNNKTRAVFSRLERTDIRDYPEAALREALLNCIVHRDYSYSGSTLINIYDDRMEYVSLGGLVPGLELDSIFLGVSVPRNPNLAAVFYRMHLIESYGTGISKIQREYGNFPVKPKFETAKGVFRVTLPNRNYESTASEDGIAHADNTVSIQKHDTMLNQNQVILDFVTEHGQITRKQVEELLSVSTTKAYHVLTELCKKQELQTKGNGRARVYVAFKMN